MNTQQEPFIKTLNDFIDILSDKQRNIVEKRFGLTGERPMTLDAIGKQNGVTRERIRQVEAGALDVLRKNIKDLGDIVEKMKYQIELLGDVRREEKLLEESAYSLSGDPAGLDRPEAEKEKIKNHVLFLLDLSPRFNYLFDRPQSHSAWYGEKDALKKMDSVHRLCRKELNKAKNPLHLDDYQELVRKIMKETGISNENAVISYLDVSKDFAFNPYFEFGLVNWPLIKPTSVGTKAYMVLDKKGEPMHFSEIADAINQVGFEDGKEARSSTTHNELIKDQDLFVLVGRGLYALKQWGYESGSLKELLVRALKKGSKTLAELVEELQKQRQIKEATVLLNLQDKKLFKKLPDGRYSLVKNTSGKK